MRWRASGKHKEIIRIESVAASGVRFSNTTQPAPRTDAAVGEARGFNSAEALFAADAWFFRQIGVTEPYCWC